MSRLFAAIVLMAFAVPASACMNDEETHSREREFRSQYGGGYASRGLEKEPSARNVFENRLRVGGGVLLLVGAVSYVAVRRRRGA